MRKLRGFDQFDGVPFLYEQIEYIGVGARLVSFLT
jgi:hypothetical protein